MGVSVGVSTSLTRTETIRAGEMASTKLYALDQVQDGIWSQQTDDEKQKTIIDDI